MHQPQSDASEQAAHMSRLIDQNKRLMEENARLKRKLQRQASEQAMSSTTVTSSGGEVDADLHRKSKVRKRSEMMDADAENRRLEKLMDDEIRAAELSLGLAPSRRTSRT